MTSDEMRPVLQYLLASFGGRPPTEQEVTVWMDTLLPVTFDDAMAALRLLRGEGTYRPSHGEFLAEVAKLARRTELPAGPAAPQHICGLCQGTGWRHVAVEGGAESVARCRCQPPPTDTHPSGCSCRVCHYGARRAADIAAGLDGLGWRGGVDPLDALPESQAPPASLDDDEDEPRWSTPATAARWGAEVRAKLAAWDAKSRA